MAITTDRPGHSRHAPDRRPTKHQHQQQQQQQRQQQQKRSSSVVAATTNNFQQPHHNGLPGGLRAASQQQLVRQRQDSQLWLSQWAHIWTKRQSPEWQPRRFSVATCQQTMSHNQQQHQYRQSQHPRQDSTESLTFFATSTDPPAAGTCEPQNRKKKSSLQAAPACLGQRRSEFLAELADLQRPGVLGGQRGNSVEVKPSADPVLGNAATALQRTTNHDSSASGSQPSCSTGAASSSASSLEGRRRSSQTSRDSLSCCCCHHSVGRLASIGAALAALPDRAHFASLGLTSKSAKEEEEGEVNRSSCRCGNEPAANGFDLCSVGRTAALTAAATAATAAANSVASSGASCNCCSSSSSSASSSSSSNSSSSSSSNSSRATDSNSSAKNKPNDSTEAATGTTTAPHTDTAGGSNQIRARLTVSDDAESLQLQQEQRKSLIRSMMRRMVSEDCLRIRGGGAQQSSNSSSLLILKQHSNTNHPKTNISNNNNNNNDSTNNCSLKRRETANGLITTSRQVNKHRHDEQQNTKQEETKTELPAAAGANNFRQRRRGETDLKHLVNGISLASQPDRSRASSSLGSPCDNHLTGYGLASCDDELLGASSSSEDRLEAAIVESWLDDHPRFVRDYFVRKANHQLINDWLITNAKLNNLAAVPSQLANEQQQPPVTSRQRRTDRLAAMTSSGLDVGKCPTEAQQDNQQQPPGHFRAANPNLEAPAERQPAEACIRSHRSNSQSGGSRLSSPSSTLPVRKISATDFETRTGSGYLRPMVSRTPDGRPTFLSQLDVRSGSRAKDLFDKEKYAHEIERQRQKEKSDLARAKQEQRQHEAVELDELGLIFELVKNICNDLDIGTLLHKILKNIAVLINADKSSLFLVCNGDTITNRDSDTATCNGAEQKYLVSQLFNVDQESDETDMEQLNRLGPTVTIPWGTGLVGYVAASGESVNIANCYEDPRFTATIDQQTGYVTRNMLCAPIFDKGNEIVGVAQVINKRDGSQFSKSDELKFKRYLQFCGIGLRNAQSYESCQLENKRNQVILDLARIIFEEQSTIEQVVHKIILHTQSLLECERCQVLLIDDGSEDLEQLLQLPAVSPSNSSASGNGDEQAPFVARPKWRPHCRNSDSGAGSRGSSPCESGEDSQIGGDLTDRRPQPVGGQTTLGEDHSSSKLFSLVFELECSGNNSELVMHNRNKEPTCAETRRKFPINIGITGYVAMTGETLNIGDAHRCELFDSSVDENSDFKHKSILCMPIRNGRRQIIGVSQLINKKNGRPFNKNDEDLFEAFSIFCGLGIHNTLMYEKVLKIMAKQRVTFEVLSYHATAPLEEAKKLHEQQVPSSYALNLTSLKFNDFSLDEQFMLKSCLRFFLDLDLMRRFQIDQLVFCNWILSVQKNYRTLTYHPIVGGNGLKASPVRYHNWRHAFNVSQMMFAILINTQICRALGELETLALLIACLCHDLDHRGTNNSFQIKSASPLAELYSTSTMEHHHFDQSVMILNSQGNQILANLSPEEYSRVISLLEEAILATDLANYFQKRQSFFQLVDSEQFDWKSNQKHRSLLRCMLMTACDVAAITKPWSIQKIVADLVMGEFYHQGDIEKNELHIEPSDLMKRENMSKLPEMQIGFIDTVCAPVYAAFAKLFPLELKPLFEGCMENRELWHELAHNSKETETLQHKQRQQESTEPVDNE